MKFEFETHDIIGTEFMYEIEEIYKLFLLKSNDYGTGNISIFGEHGVLVRMWDKLMRLKNIIWDKKKRCVKDETVIDTYRDLAIYSLLAILCRKGKMDEG